jgi:hypothetical protein
MNNFLCALGNCTEQCFTCSEDEKCDAKFSTNFTIDSLDDEDSEIYKMGSEIAEMPIEELGANCDAFIAILKKSKAYRTEKTPNPLVMFLYHRSELATDSLQPGKDGVVSITEESNGDQLSYLVIKEDGRRERYFTPSKVVYMHPDWTVPASEQK